MTIKKNYYEICDSVERLESFGGVYFCNNGKDCKYNGVNKNNETFCPIGGLVEVLKSNYEKGPTMTNCDVEVIHIKPNR